MSLQSFQVSMSFPYFYNCRAHLLLLVYLHHIHRYTVIDRDQVTGSKASLAQGDNGGIENGMLKVPH